MVSENIFKRNRNTTYLAALIFDDFIRIKFNGNNNNLTTRSNLLPNNNYEIDLNDFKNYQPNYGLGSRLFNFFINEKEPDVLDLTDFNKDLLLQIIKTSLGYTDLELRSDGFLELKLPYVSY